MCYFKIKPIGRSGIGTPRLAAAELALATLQAHRRDWTWPSRNWDPGRALDENLVACARLDRHKARERRRASITSTGPRQTRTLTHVLPILHVGRRGC